ncbi:nucleotide pyrophosphatase/phosphodiesterase isoform X1 [Selaginella moellendorffii]|uniref:nucleotide pyrophosphatase/phosphodiesterase isoform X1 n=1 Tax=Selaginella moellendorffii TaxID=88036 RepID=UPI000D1C4852|nr:nucleotide pyrophosphatase/phosphodiesterase isoform X1 [Selaginella moellendorffii]|eukprot:XP_024524876.1 nucleotide pyrophosphatase/phosphodiesterase isoform X1 [Selaginella moellendorffii]
MAQLSSGISLGLAVVLLSLVSSLQAPSARLDHRNSAFGSITRRTLLECRDPNPYLNFTLDTAGPLANVQTVVATVSGVLQPSASDWIGVFSSATHNYSDCPAKAVLYSQTGDIASLPLLCDYPLKFKFLSSDPGYLICSNKTCAGKQCAVKTCSGSVSFRLINIRTDVTFVLFSGGLAVPCILKVSQTLPFAAPNFPLYGHLSLEDSSGTSMVLAWVSRSFDIHYVEFDHGRKSMDEVTSFQIGDLCDAVPGPAKDFGWHDPGFIHIARMQNLRPGTRYSYRYGSDNSGWSNLKMFTTPPAGGAYGTKFLIFGDMGKAERDGSLEHYIQPGALQVIDAMANETVDAIFHIGDLSYATGFLAEWDHFLEMIEPVASKTAYMTAIGNHERDYPGSGSMYSTPDSGGECGVPYRSYFRMPVQDIDKPWYSIAIGPVHFTVISTEHDWSSTSEQYAWMKSDLESVDRFSTPWIVFTGHRPMYSTQLPGIISKLLPGVDPKFVAAVEPLLLRNKVDLAVWGHVHNYERTCAVFQGRCLQHPIKDLAGVDFFDTTIYSAPVHAVVGMAGFSLDDFPRNFSSWSLIRRSAFGYARVTADKKKLLFEYITTDGTVADRFKIAKLNWGFSRP